MPDASEIAERHCYKLDEVCGGAFPEIFAGSGCWEDFYSNPLQWRVRTLGEDGTKSDWTTGTFVIGPCPEPTPDDPPTISSFSTVPSTPLEEVPFDFTIDGRDFDPGTVEVFYLGPVCATPSACVVARC